MKSFVIWPLNLINLILMENLPLWLIILMFAAPVIGIAAMFLAQRKVHNQSLKKRRKRLCVIFAIFIAFCLILTAIDYRIWQDLLSNIGFLVILLLLVVNLIYGFFRKDKAVTISDNQNDLANENHS